MGYRNLCDDMEIFVVDVFINGIRNHARNRMGPSWRNVDWCLSNGMQLVETSWNFRLNNEVAKVAQVHAYPRRLLQGPTMKSKTWMWRHSRSGVRLGSNSINRFRFWLTRMKKTICRFQLGSNFGVPIPTPTFHLILQVIILLGANTFHSSREHKIKQLLCCMLLNLCLKPINTDGKWAKGSVVLLAQTPHNFRFDGNDLLNQKYKSNASRK